MFSVDRVFFVKAYTPLNKWDFVYCLNNILLKKPPAHAHLNRSVGPYIMYMETCFGPLIGALDFAQFTIKEKQNTIFVQNLKFYAHAQQLKNEED